MHQVPIENPCTLSRTQVRGIVLIVIDCLRADHVSGYGYSRATTPTLAKLAEHGMLWEKAFSASTCTRPAVTSLLTGLHPSRHGMFQTVRRDKHRTPSVTSCLRRDIPTLAEAFAATGWRCGAFLNNVQLEAFTRLDRGFDTYLATAGKADAQIRRFLGWLSEDSQRPFFAYLHFLEAHWPYKPRRRHVAMFGGDRDQNRFRDLSAKDFGKLRRAIHAGRSTLSPAELIDLELLYDGAVRRLDGKIKAMLRSLDELRLRKDTAIVVTADHGEEFMDHASIGHGHTLYEELTHVPLIAAVPGGPECVRIGTPVSLVNVPATLLSLAGVNHGLPGTDIMDGRIAADAVVSELGGRHRFLQSIREHRWKLHRKYDFPKCDGPLDSASSPNQWLSMRPHRLQNELYDLATDPGEHNNLAGREDTQMELQRLTTKLDDWTQQGAIDSMEPGSDFTEIDERVVRRLRDLGYVD